MDTERTQPKEVYQGERPLNYTGLIPVFLLLVVIIAKIFYELYKSNKRQKTRSTQERRMFVGSRARPSSYAPPEPTIYVSPSNLPPPPKYEAMAPPSYEEVVGIHYPQFQQPITAPITTALSQNADCRTNAINPNSNVTIPDNITVPSNVIVPSTVVVPSNVNISSNVTAPNNVIVPKSEPSTVITVSDDERRTSVSVATSS